jgi:hypothetical protein
MNTRYSAVESFATLAIGLWSVALIDYLSSGISGLVYFLAVVGVVFGLLTLYLILPTKWGQESLSQSIARRGYLRIAKSLGWLIIGLVFGVALAQSKVPWMIVAGLITMIVSVVGFYVAIWPLRKGNRPE